VPLVSVGTTPTKLLERSDWRVEYILQNQGSVNCYIADDRNVATSGELTGRILSPSAIETANEKDDPVLIRKAQWGIVVSGTCNIWVYESRKSYA